MGNLVLFNPSSKETARAVQAWQILVGMAKNRQTVTYGDLSRLMFRKNAADVLSRILGHIAFYCIDNNLPPLTSIVVSKRRGTPGEDIPIDLEKIDAKREEVYLHDWFNIYPPSEKVLAETYTRHREIAAAHAQNS